MSESSLQIIERLGEGLTTVDLPHVTKLVEMFGLYGAARIMGYDVSHYNNLLMAGRLAIENLKINSPKTLLEYAREMKSRLNTMTYNFIVDNHVELQAAIDKNAHRDYDHDWFSANTMITMYSANPAYGKEGIEIPQYTWMRIAIQLYHDSSNPLGDVIRAYEEMSIGWYTPASPTIFNAGMRDPQMASCFVEGTEVCTLSGVKCIESVAVGDIVITHTGSAKKVSQVHRNKLGDRKLYDLKCWKTPNIIVTGNHRFLAMKRNRQLDWVPVDQLTSDYYIAIPRKKIQITDPETLKIDLAKYLKQIQRGDNVTYEYDVTEDMIYTTSASINFNAAGECTTRHKHAHIKRYLSITHEAATAIGMWYGDCCIRNMRDRKVGEQQICGMNIVAEKNNERLVTFWVEAMKNLTGIQASISHKTNIIYAEIHSPILGEIFNILFGKGFSGKRLPPFMYRWAAPHVRSFMIGLMSTDGCVTINGDMVITLTNRTLVKQIYHMCRQIGEDVSYNEDKKLRNGDTDISATIKLSKGWIQPCELYKYYEDNRLNILTTRINTNGAYRDMGMIFTKVKSITESSIDKPEYVYTLGIEDDHSYNVEGLIVENCFLLTIGDDLESILKTGIFRGGMISKFSGGLGFDVSRVRHSEIRETGWSNGIIPMLQLYNYMVRYVDQCFTPETIVYTEAGPKYIENIMPGDRVITRDGSLDDVRFSMPHDYNGDIIEVNVQNTFKPIRVTPTHPILVIRNQAKGINYSVITNRLDKLLITPEWVDAAALKDTDLVAFPVPTYIRDIPDFTDTDMYMYGLMIGDGSIDKRDGACKICLGTERKSHLIDFVHKYLALRNIRFNDNPDTGFIHIAWSGGSNFRFSRSSLYDADGNKIIHPYFIHMPREKSLALIAGLLATDGSIGKELVLDTSEQVAESVRYIMLRMGVGTSGYIRDRIGETHDSVKGLITTRKLCYSVRIPKIPELAKILNVPAGLERQSAPSLDHPEEDISKFTKYILHNGIVWSRVESVSLPFRYQGKIYDLEISTNHNYLTHMGLAHNGGRRKGAATIFLRPHHIDVEDFIELPRKVGDKYARAHDLNICLWTSWIFWERVRTGGTWTLFCPARVPQLNDVYGVEFTKAYIAAEEDTTIAPRHKKVINARDLYNKILDIQRETGMPYLMNGDAANIKSNHRHLGYIRSSNLCVAGETPILTKNGYFPIQSLQDQDVEVWNGNEWSKVTVKQTAPRRHLITVYFSNGRCLTCTPDHKFIIGDGPLKEARRVPAQLLVPGVKLRQENLPIVDGSVPFSHPYLHGSLCAFGCFTDKGPLLDIMGQAMTTILNHPDMITTENGSKAFPDNLPAPYVVPINSSIAVKLQWLSGLLTARSFVNKLGVTLININDTFLQDIQLLLTTLGIRSFFEQNTPTKVPLPENKNIMISNCGLMIPWSEFSKLIPMGLTTHHVIPETCIDKFKELLVTEIIDIGRLSPTYCFTEEKNNAGVFNGILTGQCLEVIEFTDDETIAVCNLHSLSLRMFGKHPLNRGNKDLNNALCQAIDFSQLSYISRRVVENLNRVIDHNWYPLDKIKDGRVKPKIINRSNKRHRPVGMGVSGFAELLHILDLPFEDPAVNVLNKMVFACMYWNALAQSVQLAIKEGTYESFHGSPTSQGKLQFDLWQEEFKIIGPNSIRKEEDDEPIDPSVWGQEPLYLYSADRHSIIDVIKPTWTDLKRCIMKYGLRNSLLIALMPTASTAQVRRNCESVEAHQNNMYSRKVLKCSYPVLNRYLVTDLESLRVWNDAVVEFIRVKNGSILGLTDYIVSNPQLFPDFTGNVDRISFLEKKYKTMWEIPQKTFMKLASERGRYIDHSSSTNVYIRDCTDGKLRACHLYANMLGLKTIMYYLRQTGGETIKFTADPSMIKHIKGVVVEVANDDDDSIKFTADPSLIKHIKGVVVEVANDDDDSVKLENIDLTGPFLSRTATKKTKSICDDHSCCT